jgi:hypothetical protein
MPPTTEIFIDIPALYPAQQYVKDHAKRYNVLAWGRRGGKTTFGYDLVTETVIAMSHEEQIIRTLMSGGKVGYFGPNFIILDPVWNFYVNGFKPLIVDKDETKKSMKLRTGGEFECWSMHSEAIIVARSRDYDRVIVDEAAHINNLKRRLEKEILPTLIDRTGDLWLFSSTNGEDDFKEYFDKGQDPNEPEWFSSKLPTWENPYLPKKERDRVYKLAVIDGDPVARQEYGAEFINGSDNFVPVSWVDACGLNNDWWKPLDPYTPICVGIDVGTKNDLFAITGWGRDGETRKYKPAFVKIFHPEDLTTGGGIVTFAKPKEFLRSVARNYHVLTFAYDPYQCQGMADDLYQEGLGMFEEFTQGQKRTLADSLLYTLIRDRDLEWSLYDEDCKEMAQHIKNANAKIEGEDKRRLVKRNDNLKIDAAVASAMSIASLQEFNV